MLTGAENELRQRRINTQTHAQRDRKIFVKKKGTEISSAFHTRLD